MIYNNCRITTEYGSWAAWHGNDLVATAPSKSELFLILDNLVSRYHRNK